MVHAQDLLDVSPGVSKHSLKTDQLSLRYGLHAPEGAQADQTPRPLVLALHYGFDRSRPFPSDYGTAFMERVVVPGLESLDAYIVAPDSHGMPWTDERIAGPVLELLDALIADPRIDGRRVIVTGYSMGGAGTWFFAAEHTERFAAAVPMAGRLKAEWLDQVGELPVHVLHSHDDELISFEQVQRVIGSDPPPNLRLTELRDITHFQSPRYARALTGVVVPWLEEVFAAVDP